jgi:hypothetical protein
MSGKEFIMISICFSGGNDKFGQLCGKNDKLHLNFEVYDGK